MDEGTQGPIVVGIDGSPQSRAALQWALDEARRRDAAVHIVHAWQFPSIGVIPYGTASLPLVTPGDIEKAAIAMMDETVSTMHGASTIDVTTEIERGHPAAVLVAAAKGADLLVVGSHGRGGFRGMLLGSVSTQVAQHATCPVVIVKGDQD